MILVLLYLSVFATVVPLFRIKFCFRVGITIEDVPYENETMCWELGAERDQNSMAYSSYSEVYAKAQRGCA